MRLNQSMPSKTPAQHKLMTIAAHTKGGYGGVPQKVGRDFAAADKREAGGKFVRKGSNAKAATGKTRSWTGK
jgi:hypothetical protein